MPTISEVVESLERAGALRLGESPWEPNATTESVDIFQVDWDRLFPARRRVDEEEQLVDDDWNLDEDVLGEIFAPLSPNGADGEHLWDVCAWYQPIHFHGYDWGIRVREECLVRLARNIYLELLTRGPMVGGGPGSPLLAKALLRIAFSLYYHHELYHHKTECLGLRLHAVERKSSYIPYFRLVYGPAKGTDDQVEEALANAYMFRNFDEAPGISRSISKAARRYLDVTFPKDPPGYRLAPKYVKNETFEDGQRILFSRLHEATLKPARASDDWALAPRINQSFFNIRSEIWIVVPKGRRPHVPITSTPLKTCSTEQMIKICEKRGYTVVSGGKGSHIKLKKSAHPTLIVPGQRDNLSPPVAKNILEGLGGYKIQDLPSLLAAR